MMNTLNTLAIENLSEDQVIDLYLDWGAMGKYADCSQEEYEQVYRRYCEINGIPC